LLLAKFFIKTVLELFIYCYLVLKYLANLNSYHSTGIEYRTGVQSLCSVTMAKFNIKINY